ncbi:hypothetical protein CAEBREN_30463 [Caenorhabditis brenneri]|uniref:G-protein coupled receptors family 1 profile domain-containing protein n=1 Tax=Caenorhabditis brenneri TaxID=135651 RepID=G0PI99_CAEBE|nr:hypothetical protein CAEBREN_30463 [Caenorhabditis brenneri]
MTRGISFKSTLFITILYFFFNVFHLIILTRTQMRVLSVSREMVLIAICGVLTGIFGTFKSVVEIIDHEYVCSHSYWYFLLVLIYFLVFQVLNQVILWEIVYITFLRAAIILDVRYGMKTEKIKSRMRGFIYFFFIVFLVNHFIRISFHRISEVEEKDRGQRILNVMGCDSTKEYTILAIAGNCLRRILLTIAGITSLAIPIFLMIILSIFLVFELYHSQSPLIKTEESAHRQNSAAQGLLVFLSFYILAELPYVVLFGLGIYNPADFEQLDEYTYTQVDIFIYVNMCLGILVYCLMSSQYRATVRATFWRRNSKVAPSSGEKGVDAGSSKVTN